MLLYFTNKLHIYSTIYNNINKNLSYLDIILKITKGEMMKKIIAMLMLSVSFMFAAMNLQTASKDELMSIKGIGPKKADQIIKYRKTNRIKSADDLQNIKGFGPGIIANVKGDKKVSKAKMKEKTKKS